MSYRELAESKGWTLVENLPVYPGEFSIFQPIRGLLYTRLNGVIHIGNDASEILNFSQYRPYFWDRELTQDIWQYVFLR